MTSVDVSVPRAARDTLPIACVILALVACSGGADPIDPPSRDAGVAPRADGGTASDAGSASDAGHIDAGESPRDGGPNAIDSGVDAGTRDGGEIERDGGAPRDGGVDDFAAPNQPGPFTTTAQTGTPTATSGNDVPMDCLVPTAGPANAPYPVALVLHGFRIPVGQYRGYVERLASHGFVACAVDFEAGFVPNHVEHAQDILAGLDWVLANVADADSARIALVGHSLGGKLAVYGAAMDPRVGAIVGLDPVDGSMICNATRCPDATDMLPVAIPMAFLGETLDQTGAGGQACAPAADNYATFYTPASSPAIEVTLNGASHMSFVDDPVGCGLVCSFCEEPTLAQATALEISRAYAVSFLRRHLLGDARYDAWLTGADADAAWIQPGTISVQSK